MAWVSLGLRYRMLLSIMILQICIEDCSKLCWTNSTVLLHVWGFLGCGVSTVTTMQ
jgi:hypothetical protein